MEKATILCQAKDTSGSTLRISVPCSARESATIVCGAENTSRNTPRIFYPLAIQGEMQSSTAAAEDTAGYTQGILPEGFPGGTKRCHRTKQPSFGVQKIPLELSRGFHATINWYDSNTSGSTQRVAQSMHESAR